MEVDAPVAPRVCATAIRANMPPRGAALLYRPDDLLYRPDEKSSLQFAVGEEGVNRNVN